MRRKIAEISQFFHRQIVKLKITLGSPL